MMAFAAFFALMLIGHGIGDGPLQGVRMSRAKRAGANLQYPWPLALAVHAAVHGLIVMTVMAGVWLIGLGPVSLVALGWAEAVAHAAIDSAKCRDWIGTAADQALHVACKAAWAAIAVGVVSHG